MFKSFYLRFFFCKFKLQAFSRQTFLMLFMYKQKPGCFCLFKIRE